MKLADRDIRIISAPYFVATKIEAFNGRGNNDFLSSPDLEDIITILDGRKEIVSEIQGANKELQAYIAKSFNCWLNNKHFINAIPGLIAPDNASQNRLKLVLARFTEISGILKLKKFSVS